MSGDTIDLMKNYLLLEPDGAAVLLPGGGDFWSQLMSGHPATAVGAAHAGRLDPLGNASSGR